MTWTKLGSVFNPLLQFDWAVEYCLQPTPIIIDHELRIYFGTRDSNGVSRITYIVVDQDDPTKVIYVHKAPVLDIGRPGMFDENGVVPCRLEHDDGIIRLYYAGYQIGQKVKFTVFGGLAISHDRGESFHRVSEAPITDRIDGELLFRVIHSVIKLDNNYHAWYGAGENFVNINSKSYPSYNIRHMVSPDGINNWEDSKICLDFQDDDQYRIARPWVIFFNDEFHAYFYIATKSSGFSLYSAVSCDGINWTQPKGIDFLPSEHDHLDKEMISYPSVIVVREKLYLFYNGNDYGRLGFCVAESRLRSQ